MSDDEQGSVTRIFRQMRAGDEAALGHLWNRFLPRLTGLARTALQRRPNLRPEADEAVQSAFLSLWRGIEAGRFECADREDLWNLLATITVRKSKKKLRRELAEKRGGGRAVSSIEENDALRNELAQVSSQDFDLHCEELVTGLKEDLQAVALGRLMGATNAELAACLGCTERSVERKLQQIRSVWKGLLSD